MITDDAELVRQVRQGNKRAFGGIVARYHRTLLGVARSYSRSGDDAADAVQNALLLAYVHLGQLRDPNLLGPWLRQLTVNACRQQVRAHKQTMSLDAVPESGKDEMPITDMTGITNTRLLLDQALSCLSPETRLTVTLYYQRELSLAEIAAFQEVPTTTIKSRLRHARARLRKEMEQLLEETLEETIREEMKTSSPDDMAPRLLRRLESVGDIGFTVFSPDGSRLITLAWLEVTETTFRSALSCFESDTGKPLWSLPHSSWMFSPQFLPDNSRIAVCAGLPGQRGGVGQLLLVEADAGAVVQVIADTPAAKSISLSPDGRLVALGGSEEYEDYRSRGWRGMAVLYNIATGEPVLKVAPHLNYVTALAISPDGTTLATSSHLRDADPEAKNIWLGGDIRLWDTTTGELRHKLEREDRGTRHNIAFSPDGAILAAPNGREGEVRLWDVATGAITRTLEGNKEREPVFVLAFSSDGATLACGCGDNAVRLWDAQTGVLRRTMREFSHCIYALAFAPDGKTLVTADKNGVVQLWEV